MVPFFWLPDFLRVHQRKVTKEIRPAMRKAPEDGGFRGAGKNSLYAVECRDGLRRSRLLEPADSPASIRSDSLPA